MPSQETAQQASERDDLNACIDLLWNGLPQKLHNTFLKNIINLNNGSNRCHLLGLPSEIRNQIFRLVLNRQDRIRLSATSPVLPGLLSTSKQIRHETVTMYCTENSFEIVLVDYDARAVAPAFAFQTLHLVEAKDGKVNPGEVHQYVTLGVPNWQNLVGWCRRIHACEMPAVTVDPTSAEETDIGIAAIHQTVQDMKARPWEEVEVVLRGFRKFMVLLDAAWAT